MSPNPLIAKLNRHLLIFVIGAALIIIAIVQTGKTLLVLTKAPPPPSTTSNALEKSINEALNLVAVTSK